MKPLYQSILEAKKLIDQDTRPEHPLWRKGSDITDDYLYYLEAWRHFWKLDRGSKRNKSTRRKFWKEYGIKDWEDVRNMSKYGRENDNVKPILKDEDEFIHRKDWDLEGIDGQSKEQIDHPHFLKGIKHIESHHKKKHDTAIIVLCKDHKPYRASLPIKVLYNRFRNFADFIIISNPGYIPIEFDNMYPYRWYAWNPTKEDKEVNEYYDDVMTSRFSAFDEKFNYKHYLICAFEEEAVPFTRLYEKGGKWKDKIIQMYTHQYISAIDKKYGYGNLGLTMTRIPNMPDTRERIAKELRKYVPEEHKEYLSKYAKAKTEDVKKLNKEFAEKFGEDTYN